MVAVGLVLLAIAAAALYLITDEPRNAQNAGGGETTGATLPSELATGQMAALVIHKSPQDIPDFTFTDADGKEQSLAKWRGKTVLVNLWATWCAPCREEMPGLAELQRNYGGDDFEVVAISLDQKGAPAAKAFLDEIKISNLALYLDPTTKSLRSLKSVGLPTTILVNPQGKEVARLMGTALWDSPDAVRVIETAIGRADPKV